MESSLGHKYKHAAIIEYRLAIIWLVVRVTNKYINCNNNIDI